MFKACPIIDTCKIKVKLEEETQEVDFEKPIKEIVGHDSITPKSNNRKLFVGILIGAASCAGLMYSWMRVTETILCNHHHTPISIESAIRLKDQGISWNVEKRIWDVTEVSPIIQMVGR